MADVKQIRESAGISYNGCAVFTKSEVDELIINLNF